MRFLVKVSFPVEAGNAAAKKNGFKVIQKILKQQKPEAAYFIADGGRRTGILIIDMKDASDLANRRTVVSGTKRQHRGDPCNGC
jgi:hypothetical protein